ncbi:MULTISPECIES: DUF6507 family protein [Streptomyces]|uniref:Uncharacterized protein n=1 Tax=Streptomyces fradiae TaxID=1906 RepID=A0ACC4WHP5_STRFR|nr:MULTISPECIES: DUF6507 family protein [Streptomyces]KNE84133.1 hypothetical protein ADZ36_01680 [Streptomyces fradiae]OFA60654.1 hypothetical protein BEN35_01740 [Streptomyces fradiae]
MSGWDIDVNGVQGVLSKTGEVAGKLETQASSYSDHMESAASSAGTIAGGGEAPEMGLVGAALAEFAMKTQDDLMFVGARAGKSMTGAVDAVKAYNQGDLDMAAAAQREALKAPDLEALKAAQGQNNAGGNGSHGQQAPM